MPAKVPRAASCRSASCRRSCTRQETGLWLFPDAHVVHYPVSGGTELAVVVIVDDEHDDEDWSAPVPPAWVEQRLPACAPPLRELVATARTWRKWALHTLPVPQSWTRGPIALLGDAAHPVLPFLAQGGVLALEDACRAGAMLSRDRTTWRGPSSGMSAGGVRARSRVAEASRRNGAIYHLSGALALARNVTLRTVPSQRLMARYDWLYGWRAD